MEARQKIVLFRGRRVFTVAPSLFHFYFYFYFAVEQLRKHMLMLVWLLIVIE